MKESKLTDNQILFKQYLQRCTDKEHNTLADAVKCELYRNVGRVTFELSEVEIDEVIL